MSVESEAPARESSEEADDEAAPAAAPRAYRGEPMPGSSQKAGERAGSAPQGEIEALSRELDQTLQLSTPDCTTAWTLRDRICDLADRLCDLAGRSGEPELNERCTDGKARCQRATSRIRATCTE